MTEKLWEKTAEVAREIESMENQEQLEGLIDEVEFTCTMDGSVKEVTATMRTMNIRVDIDLYAGTVTGYSHGRHSVPILDDDCRKDILIPLGNFYEDMFKASQQ